jgi:guanine deaminase
MAPTYTLYHGTFVQLPRSAPPSGTKHALSINSGALWVSNADGCIKGFDWSVGTQDAAALTSFVQRKGWMIVPEREALTNGTSATADAKETVTVVAGGQKGRNGFFFPGFIGIDPFCPSQVKGKKRKDG